MHDDQSDQQTTGWLHDYRSDSFVPKYKAVGTMTGRRGIRLENAFWEVLELISQEKNCKVGDLVQAAREFESSSNNITSAIRVGCLEWLTDRQQTLIDRTDDRTVRNIINACPTAAIALSVDKRLHSFNQPFLQKIAESFSVHNLELIPPRLRLVLDVQINALVEQLRDNENRPIPVGIALGIDDRRIRGQLNVVLAPRLKQNLILGYLQQ